MVSPGADWIGANQLGAAGSRAVVGENIRSRGQESVGCASRWPYVGRRERGSLLDQRCDRFSKLWRVAMRTTRRWILGLVGAMAVTACSEEPSPEDTTSGDATAMGSGQTTTGGGGATTNTGTTGSGTTGSTSTGSTGLPAGTTGLGTTGETASSGGSTGPSSSSGAGNGMTGGGVTETDAGVQQDAGGGATANNGSVPATGTFPPVTELSEDGPFEAVTVQNTGPNRGYTLYHPRALADSGVLHPIVTWGNGGLTTPVDYDYLLPHLATHGFVVIASNNPLVGAADMRSGVDWVITQNESAESPLYQALDVENVSAMGYSNGGLATLGMSDDPRLVTIVIISGGNTTASARTTNIPKIHTPAAYLCTADAASRGNCAADFAALDVPAVFGVLNGSTHTSVTELLGLGNRGIMERLSGAVLAWLRWRQMADVTQEALFLGDACGLCTDSNWTVEPPKNW